MRKLQSRSWQLTLKVCGWWPAVVSAALLLFILVIAKYMAAAGNPIEPVYLRRAVEVIVPACFAIQAAFLVGPDNEPALELLLSQPRTMPGLFMQRLLAVGLLHLLIAVMFMMFITLSWHIENLLLSTIRWTVDCLILGGVAVFTTQLTRQGVFGMLLAMLLWASSVSGGNAILNTWRWFWPFHVYLQPETLGMGTFLLNRLFLAGAGMALFLLAMRFLSDEDRLLGTR